MPRIPKPPSYRKRTVRGKEVAYVTLKDTATGRRKDFWLGEFNSPESLERYARIIASWGSEGKRLPRDERSSRSSTRDGITVSELCLAYWKSIQGYYNKRSMYGMQMAIRVIRQLYGTWPAADIGPNVFRKIREAFVVGADSAKPPRLPLCRKTVNMRMQVLTAMFRWASAHEMLPVTVYQALKTLEPLKRGRSRAREPEPVKPANEAMVNSSKQHLSPQVATMIDLQLLTGMRPGEVVNMRPCDIDMGGRVWLYQLQEHKTAHYGKARTVYLGPRSQDVIRPFLADRATTTYLFSPAQAEAIRLEKRHKARKTPLKYGNRPGTNRSENPSRPPKDLYTVDSYRRAIQYACDKAFPPPEPLCKRDDETNAEWQARLTEKQKEELKAWRKEHRWHPHQLRHNYATNVRRQYGLEAAQILLGHSSALITDAVYAERDMTKAQEIVSKIG